MSFSCVLWFLMHENSDFYKHEIYAALFKAFYFYFNFILIYSLLSIYIMIVIPTQLDKPAIAQISYSYLKSLGLTAGDWIKINDKISNVYKNKTNKNIEIDLFSVDQITFLSPMNERN